MNIKMDGHKQLNYYRLEPDEVIEQLRSSRDGLDTQEATERLEELGANQLPRTKKNWAVLIFLRQLRNILVIMLLVSAGISLYLRANETAVVLLVIALINTTIGFIQEYKAETLMESLAKLVVPKAKVLRSGKLDEVDSTELVPGDIVYIEEGDSVPADLRVLDEEELATNDFALTGESNPTRKFVHAITDEVPLSSRNNLVFMGTTVAIGHAHGIVVATGASTELGRIAHLSQGAKPGQSPLQREMNNLATRVAQGTTILAGALLLIALQIDLGMKDALLFAVGIAIAMIPNGLAAEINVTLAQTAGRMARARALVKKLSAVETLGATNIIATDKTGTLTKNEMTVQTLLIGKTAYNVTGTGYETNGTIVTEKGRELNKKELTELELFFTTGALASNAHVNPPDDDHATWYTLGDPTEGALITLAHKAGVDPASMEKINPEIKEFQFDSARKRMSSVRYFGDHVAVFVKGAPESVLEHSTELWDHGHVRPLHAADRTFFAKHNEHLADQAMRNLAFAYRILPAKTDLQNLRLEDIEKNLTFLGMVSMMDPLREQVPAAMQAAREAHIKVTIITGDFAPTAEAIARKANLALPGQEIAIVMGDEMNKLDDGQILQLVERGGTVFSRVSPEDKLRIVEIVKESGHVIAVTGDGINDAPALKRADIGVAMGKTGTDVSKDAAEIVLLDDSFGTLIGAVQQGRLTYQNIRKATRCVLTDNATELAVILISLAINIFFHVPMAITAIQILAIDIIAQMFPVTALGWDQSQHNLMRDRPRRLSDHIINRRAVIEFISYGLLTAVLAYGNYLFFFARQGINPSGLTADGLLYAQATTLTYVTIILCQYMNLLLVRSERGAFFSSYLWSNKKLLGAFGLSFFFIFNIMYNPWVRDYLNTAALGAADWLLAIAAAAIYLTVRLLHRHTHKHSREAVMALHQAKQMTRQQTAS